MTCYALSGCSTNQVRESGSEAFLPYLAVTPEPDAPPAPVDNAALAAYTLAYRGQLRLCNADKVSAYELYLKEKR